MGNPIDTLSHIVYIHDTTYHIIYSTDTLKQIVNITPSDEKILLGLTWADIVKSVAVPLLTFVGGFIIGNRNEKKRKESELTDFQKFIISWTEALIDETNFNDRVLKEYKDYISNFDNLFAKYAFTKPSTKMILKQNEILTTKFFLFLDKRIEVSLKIYQNYLKTLSWIKKTMNDAESILDESEKEMILYYNTLNGCIKTFHSNTLSLEESDDAFYDLTLIIKKVLESMSLPYYLNNILIDQSSMGLFENLKIKLQHFEIGGVAIKNIRIEQLIFNIENINVAYDNFLKVHKEHIIKIGDTRDQFNRMNEALNRYLTYFNSPSKDKAKEVLELY